MRGRGYSMGEGQRARAQRKSVRGSYTVEAAFLLPLAFGLVLFLISCAFFLHDRVSTCAWVHETILWEGFQKREEGSRDFAVETLVTEAKESVAKEGEEVTVTCRGKERLLPSFVRDLFALEPLHLEESEHMRQIYGEAKVRQRAFLEGVYERWK